MIFYTNYGVASRVGKDIFINRNLRKYPKLHDAILSHEKEHTESGYSSSDLIQDIRIKQLSGLRKEYYLFFLRHPWALTQLLPIWVYNKKVAVDITMLISWIFAILAIFIINKIIYVL